MYAVVEITGKKICIAPIRFLKNVNKSTDLLFCNIKSLNNQRKLIYMLIFTDF